MMARKVKHIGKASTTCNAGGTRGRSSSCCHVFIHASSSAFYIWYIKTRAKDKEKMKQVRERSARMLKIYKK